MRAALVGVRATPVERVPVDLGPPLVRAVVGAHGGTVVADSAPGRGLAVEVFLPTGA